MRVRLGKKDYINGAAANNVSDLTEIHTKPEYTVTSVPDEYITAPVKKGDKIGYYIIYKNNEEFTRVDMLADDDVEKISYNDYINAFFARWAWCADKEGN